MRRPWLLALALAACGPSPHPVGCVDAIGPGDLVITEVFVNYHAPIGGAATDAGKEWFEIYNASDRPLELGGLTLTHSRPDGSSARSHAMTNITIAPAQFFTLGDAAPDAVPPYISYGYASDLGTFFNTGGGKLALACGGTEIDAAAYDAIKEGHSRELSSASAPDYTFNDDAAHWCQGNDSEFEAGNFGTPGSSSDCQPLVVGACSDAGVMRAIDSPLAGDLVITEVMPDPAKTADNLGEWFEAKVIRDVDLNGLGLDRAGDSAKPDLIADASCLHVTAGSVIAFAHSADAAVNGGLPSGSVKGTFKFALVAGSAASPGDVQILAGTTVVDAVTWTRSSAGKSLQLDPTRTDPVSNDQPSNFCDGSQPYGAGDLGTPAAANAACVLLPPPGTCMDGSTNRAIAKPTPGQLAISEFLANPANVTGFTDAQREWFEIVNTGATAFDLNGLGVVGKSGTPAIVSSAACLSIAPGAYGLFARSGDATANAMLPAPSATFSFSLVDTNGAIQILDGATVLDAVSWTSVTPGVATQLDPAHLTAADNDIAASFCKATAPYGDGTNLGTPMAANAPCP